MKSSHLTTDDRIARPLLLIKEDINMPRGKILAQVGHAISLMVLNLMAGNYEHRRLSPSNTKHMEGWFRNRCPVEIRMVSSASFDQAVTNYADQGVTVVEDHGRTVFNGVKTETVAVVPFGFILPFEHQCVDRGQIVAKDKERAADELRQVLLVNTRSKQCLNDLIGYTVLATVQTIYWHMEHVDGEHHFDLTRSRMGEWLDGAFAKIALSTKAIEQQKSDLLAANIGFEALEREGECVLICTQPVEKSLLEPITSGLRVL